MNTLINNLLLFARLNEQQINLLERMTQRIQLRKEEYFAEPGHISAQLAYVDQGVLRYNYYTRQAENITSSLIGEGNFVASISPIRFPIIQSEYLQAMTDCTLWVIGKSDLEELAATIADWDSLLQRISQKAIVERRRRIIPSRPTSRAELTATQYLEKFTNLNKYLTATQVLPYFQLQATNRAST
jgi:CRP-like cAMP-binding protein